MRGALALVLLAALVAASSAAADPGITNPSPGEGIAQWTFSNVGNYTLTNVTVGATGATLSTGTGIREDTAQSDFAAARSAANIDLARSPGDVRILDTAQQGPVQWLTVQPDPAQMVDNYLYEGNGGNLNFGTSPDLRVGNWGGSEWNRAILRLPPFPIPANASLVTARLELYMHTADTPGPMDLSVHRIPTSWTELGSNWDTRDGVIPWNATGGDFDPTPEDLVAGVGTTLGWYTWNVTTLAQAWWRGTIPNQGVMVRQADDTLANLGRKQFYSSDAANISVRPRVLLGYTMPDAVGTLESRPFDAGGIASWTGIWWNATTGANSVVRVQSRSGNTSPADSTWSPWSSPYANAGDPIASPVGRYLQYRLTLVSWNATTPVVHDVAATFRRYASSGLIRTEPFAPSNLQSWERFDLNWSGPSGTLAVAAYSQDGGTSWIPVAPGDTLGTALPSAILLRISLVTSNETRTPSVHAFSVRFTIAGGPFGAGIGSAWWWLVLAAALTVAGVLVGRRVIRAPFRPTDLFVIHGDGRLVARVGDGGAAVHDELAVSGMFTLVAQFVRDSFGGPSGTGGELRSLEVDDNEVAIARGAYLYMAVVIEGERPAWLAGRILAHLRRLEEAYRPRLYAWDGLRESRGDFEDDLAWFLKGKCRTARLKPGLRYHA